MKDRPLFIAILSLIVCFVQGFEARICVQSENPETLKSFEKGLLFTIYGNKIEFQRVQIGKTFLIYQPRDATAETKWELSEIESVNIENGNYAVERFIRGTMAGLAIGLFNVFVVGPFSNPGVELPESKKTLIILGTTGAFSLAGLILGLTEKKYDVVYRRQSSATGMDVRASFRILPDNGAALRISFVF